MRCGYQSLIMWCKLHHLPCHGKPLRGFFRWPRTRELLGERRHSCRPVRMAAHGQHGNTPTRMSALRRVPNDSRRAGVDALGASGRGATSSPCSASCPPPRGAGATSRRSTCSSSACRRWLSGSLSGPGRSSTGGKMPSRRPAPMCRRQSRKGVAVAGSE